MLTHNSAHIVTAATVILCSGVLLPADQTTTPGQAPVFRSGVELVTVDVGVVDRQGNPVKGLGAGDFVVNVAGHPRRVVTAEFVDVAGARHPGVTAPKETGISTNEGVGVGRMFVFVVDQNTLEPGNVRHVARAASRFFTGLSFVDRSSLVLMPAGPNVDFTWAHDRVQTALGKVIGQASPITSWELGSLTEARDIANRNLVALRAVGQRECGGTFAGGIGGGGGFDPIGSAGGPPAPTGGPTTPGPGGGTTGGQGGGTTTGGGQTGSGSGRSGGGGSSGGRNFGTDSCTRDIQMRAEWTWRGAQMTSLSSLTAFRQVLAALEPIPGDKTVILISGGWPLDEREQTALLASVADEAAAARATMFSLFVPGSTSTASRRLASATPTSDHWLHSWPLETLAAMSGGTSFRVDVGAETAFERLGREMSGFYRLGVEKEPTDADGKSRRMRVQVSRGSTTVRAREIFDARTFSDRNASARLASALDSPIPATGIGLRVTSYLASDPEDSSRLKVVLAGEASRVDPGEAEIQLLVRDLEGKKILMGEKPLGEPTGDGLSFSANVALTPGNYIIRVAVIDGTGRVGSVDHRTDVHASPLGAMSATGPLLVRVPTEGATQPRIAIDSVRQDERLALQVDLASQANLNDTDVVFEIASTADGPSLVQSIAQVSPGSRGGYALAQAVADMRVLPPGPYIARAKVRSGTQAVGEVRRSFNVTEPLQPALADATVVSPTVLGRLAPTRAPTRPVMSVAPFAIDQVLAPAVLGAFLDRVAARADAKSTEVRDIVERARSAPIEQLEIPDALVTDSAVASFLRGVSLLANKKLEPAANAFRNAMRASADFYPAMVYLGACYAAGGRDKEAAGAWRTALIKESDTLPLHILLADAQLRQNHGDQALETLDGARARWPADDGLKRRFVLAALLAGEYADGLQTLDDLIGRGADDEPTLTAGLLALYEAFMSGRPVEDADKDRARMTRLADSYRARGGPSMALVDTWLAAALGKR